MPPLGNNSARLPDNRYDERREYLELGLHIGIFLASKFGKMKQDTYDCIFSECEESFDEAMQMMEHILHCSWFRESKLYLLYGCERLHGLKPSTSPPDEGSPLPYVVSDIVPPPPVPSQGEGSAAPSGVLERLPRSPIEPGRKRRRPKRIAAPISTEIWLDHKEEIRRLYIDQGHALPRVMSEMKKRGFKATEKQIKLKLSQWGFRKHLRPDQQSRLLQEAQENITKLPSYGKSITFDGVKVSSSTARRLCREAGMGELGEELDGTPSARLPYSRSSFEGIRSKLETPEDDGTPGFDMSSAPTSPSVDTDDDMEDDMESE
ncbi:hypothetical protein F5Y14DRAFT_407335 [Nemania sp. NC0429]|nr:hypothetical protein F5Y14DRAFT_407335 [Nemania sp. NC0429]